MSLALFPLQAQEPATVELAQADVNNLYTSKSKSRVSVHDPSVVFNNGSTYYIFGSHRACAKSTDLQNWTHFSSPWKAGTNNNAGNDVAFVTPAVKKVKKGGVEVDFPQFNAMEWAARTDASYDINGNMWAPDVIYNPVMRKWCQYLSVNGDSWHSSIILLTSDNIEGPYLYQGPVCISGFYDSGHSYKDTDLELVLGSLSSLPSRYNTGRYWGNRYPNNIDPCVFYDEDGKLWMSYGSWSGGIFMLELDEETGLRDYNVTYTQVGSDDNITTDPYFGKKIAGGHYVSGEASYIQHIGNYYYLFVTNGGLDAKGGYSMRVFRSAKPDGPYVDAAGKSAIYNNYQKNFDFDDAVKIGNLIVGAYTGLGFQTVGELAQGHNSAIVDKQGRAFLVYHTRFDNGGEGHQVRVHQLLTNEDGWIVALPFEYNGETTIDADIQNGTALSSLPAGSEEFPGTFTIIRHNYGLNASKLEVAKPQTITLTRDGKVTGDLSGTWRRTAGTDYVTIAVGGTTYKGVAALQHIDGTTMEAISFSAMSSAGTVIWGYKVRPPYAIAYTLKNSTSPVSNNMSVRGHLDLSYNTFFGATCEWISSAPDILSNTGKYNPAAEDTPITLTQRISCENYRFERSYTVKALAATEISSDYLDGLVAYYDFDKKPTTNHYDADQSVAYGKQSSGTLASLEENIARFGQVLHVFAGDFKAGTSSYARINNPLQGQTGLTGFTVSLWVKRADATDRFGALWGFTEKSPMVATAQGRLYLTGNNFLSYHNAAETDTFAVNYPTSTRTDIPVNKWSLVTLTIDKVNGINVYVDQTRKGRAFRSTVGTSMADFDFQKVLDFVTSAQYFSLGLGNLFGSAEALYDDLLIYNRALTIEEIRDLYLAATRTTDFGAGEGGTGIEEIVNDEDATLATRQSSPIFDLTGRRVSASSLTPGIYIKNGKKILMK